MANTWLRLWHDMPNDPKWRTIAKFSGQPIALVQAVYLHLLVSASQNVTRGHANVTNEDLASHFDVTNRDIEAVISAMQGRVLDGTHLTGWEHRQPKKEDHGNKKTGAKSATQRKREQREREKESRNKNEMSHECHDASHHVTTDKDKDKDLKPEREIINAREQSVDNFALEPSGKFRMYLGWHPLPGFSKRATEWGHLLDNQIPFTPAQLRQFRDYWQPEDALRFQEQWEMTFAKSLEHQAIKKFNET
jgi:hypothetical protein